MAKLVNSAFTTTSFNANNGTSEPAKFWQNDCLAVYQQSENGEPEVVTTFSNPDLKGKVLDKAIEGLESLKPILGDSQISVARRILRDANIALLQKVASLPEGESFTTLVRPLPDELATAYGMSLEEGQHLAMGVTYLHVKASVKAEVSADKAEVLKKAFKDFF